MHYMHQLKEWKWKSLSHVRLFVTPWTIQSRPEYWSRYPFPSSGDLPNPPRGWTQVSSIADRFFTCWATREAQLKEWFPPRRVFLLAQMVKNLLVMQETWVSVPGLGRSSGEGNGNSHQYSCLENSMDSGAWWATVWGSQRVGHYEANNTFTFPKEPLKLHVKC